MRNIDTFGREETRQWIGGCQERFAYMSRRASGGQINQESNCDFRLLDESVHHGRRLRQIDEKFTTVRGGWLRNGIFAEGIDVHRVQAFGYKRFQKVPLEGGS